MANELITEGNTLILDVGSTTRKLAQFLKKRKNLTIFTPSLEHAMELAGNSFIKLIVTGGIVRVIVLANSRKLGNVTFSKVIRLE